MCLVVRKREKKTVRKGQEKQKKRRREVLKVSQTYSSASLNLLPEIFWALQRKG